MTVLPPPTTQFENLFIYVAEHDDNYGPIFKQKYEAISSAKVHWDISNFWLKDVINQDKQLQLDPKSYYVFHLDVQDNDHVLSKLIPALNASDAENFSCVIYTGNCLPRKSKFTSYIENNERFRIYEYAKESLILDQNLEELVHEFRQISIKPNQTASIQKSKLDRLPLAVRRHVITYLIDSLLNDYQESCFEITYDEHHFTAERDTSIKAVSLPNYQLTLQLDETVEPAQLILIEQGRSQVFLRTLDTLDILEKANRLSLFASELLTALILTDLAYQTPLMPENQLKERFEQPQFSSFKESFLIALFERQANKLGDLSDTKQQLALLSTVLQLEVDNVLHGFIEDQELTDEPTQLVSVTFRGVNDPSAPFSEKIRYDFLSRFLPEIAPEVCFRAVGIFNKQTGSFNHILTPIPDAAYRTRKNR